MSRQLVLALNTEMADKYYMYFTEHAEDYFEQMCFEQCLFVCLFVVLENYKGSLQLQYENLTMQYTDIFFQL